MIKYNNKIIDINHFPDGTLLIKEEVQLDKPAEIIWHYENNEELIALYFLTKHLRSKGITDISLKLPYIPNARQDRVKQGEDIFTLKYFSEMINDLSFSSVTVLDPHSYVSEALINHIHVHACVRKRLKKSCGSTDVFRHAVSHRSDEGDILVLINPIGIDRLPHLLHEHFQNAVF